VLELGAGTGKFTRPLLEVLSARAAAVGGRPNLVVVEPTSMGEALEAELAGRGVRLVRTTADTLGAVAAGSMDVVIAAQAFHWFADAGSISEIVRVLRPGGSLALCWNIRERRGGGAAAALESLIDSYYDAATPRQHSRAWQVPLRATAALSELVCEERPHAPHLTTAADLVAWVTSLSVIARLPPDDKAGVAARVAALLDSEATPVGATPDGTPLYAIPMYTDYFWASKRA